MADEKGILMTGRQSGSGNSAMDCSSLIREIGRGATGARSLTSEEAKSLYGAMLDGRIGELELGAILIALRMKTESNEEMTGFLLAISERLPSMPRPSGCGRPVVIPTYNGARRAANLTPFVALALQRLGVSVLLHGPDDDDDSFGRVTSGQILSAWGEPSCRTLAQAQQRLAERRLAYLPLSSWMPGLAGQLALRRRLGLRNAAHSLVKMIDPFAAQGLLLTAATHPDYLVSMREVLSRLGRRALLLRASEGEAFANPKRCPAIDYLRDGIVETLCPPQAHSLRVLPVLPETATVDRTVLWMKQVFAGDLPLPPPLARQLACCLYACQAATTLDEAVARVADRFPRIDDDGASSRVAART